MPKYKIVETRTTRTEYIPYEQDRTILERMIRELDKPYAEKYLQVECIERKYEIQEMEEKE